MRKTWACVLLALLLAAAGCGSKTEQTESTGSGFIVHSEGWTAPQSTDESETAPSSASGDVANTPSETSTEAPTATEPPAERVNCSDLATDSDAFAVVDDAGNLYMGKNETAAFAPASITKVLTALIACERASLDNMAIVSERAVNGVAIMSSGVTPSFKPGEQVSVRDLVYALILPSTNAAGNILAEHIAGTAENFAILMNDKARELGLWNSHFMNPHGLDQENHYVCARDMAVILKAAMQNPELRTIMGTRSHEIPATQYAPSRTMGMGHAMIGGQYVVSGVYAGKTGSTVKAQKTLVTAVSRGGKNFYICTLHSGDGMQYVDTDNIIRYAYAKWTGTKTTLLPVAYNFEMVASDRTGADFTYKVGNNATSAHIVFWSLKGGPAGAVTVPGVSVNPDGKVHLAFPEYGTYHVQLFVQNAAGNETVIQSDYLHCGAIMQTGIEPWNGQFYQIDPGMRVGVGPCEIEGAAFYANKDGGLQTGFVGGKYYAGADYKLVSGWVTVGYDKYYIQADGRIVKGPYIIDGVTYNFSEDGRLLQ